MFDVEKVIEAVQRRPTLYDTKSKAYNDRSKRARCWTEVAKEVYDDWDQAPLSERYDREKMLMKKWKVLRDNFVREFKVVAENGTCKKKRYLFYDKLTFLAPYIKHGEKVTNENDEDLREERTLSSLWDELHEHSMEATVLEVKKKDRLKRPAQEMSSASDSVDHNVDRFGNKAFLLSHVPIMDRLSQQGQLHARVLISRVFYDLQTQLDTQYT